MKPDIRLSTDNEGVTHWHYLMTGVLYVCGKKRTYEGSFEPEHPGFPTCIACISMVDQDRHFVPERF